MMSMTRCLLATILLAGLSPAVQAQTLAEAAAAAKAKRGVPPPVTLAPTKVYTQHDLVGVVEAVPVADADVATSPVLDASPLPSVTPPPTIGPTAAQQHDIDYARDLTSLRSAQTALRAGENGQRRLQQTYNKDGRGSQLPEMVRRCADMQQELSTGPDTLARLRVEIRTLARLVGLDPDAAAR